MKRLILTNSGGGISINVDIEVVLSVFLLNYTRHRFYGDRHIVFQIVDRSEYVTYWIWGR